jgi:hypothetical protein
MEPIPQLNQTTASTDVETMDSIETHEEILPQGVSDSYSILKIRYNCSLIDSPNAAVH